MDTALKGIRFPKPVIMILDTYARDHFGMTFSKYIVHLAIQKCSELLEKDFNQDDDQIVKHYYDLKKLQEEMEKKHTYKPNPMSDAKALLDRMS